MKQMGWLVLFAALLGLAAGLGTLFACSDGEEDNPSDDDDTSELTCDFPVLDIDTICDSYLNTWLGQVCFDTLFDSVSDCEDQWADNPYMIEVASCVKAKCEDFAENGHDACNDCRNFCAGCVNDQD